MIQTDWKPSVGDIVGAKCWPYPLHTLQRPWKGEVLASSDVRVWNGTIACGLNPTQEKVDRHVAWCLENCPGFSDRVPVLWDYGRVNWSHSFRLRPYAQDFDEWADAVLEHHRKNNWPLDIAKLQAMKP